MQDNNYLVLSPNIDFLKYSESKSKERLQTMFQYSKHDHVKLMRAPNFLRKDN